MAMRHYLGLSEYHQRVQKKQVPLHYCPDQLINGHLLMTGMSGSGKSFQAERLLESAAQAGVEVDVLDVHDELQGIAGAKACMYSQATGYGFNPLELNPDPHTGGVHRQIAWLVGLIRSVSPQLGPKQEAVMRNLMLDTYMASGIWPDNPKSWKRQSITAQQRADIVRRNAWGELRQFYPTLEDLLSYGKRKLTALSIGGDNKSISALDKLMREYKRLCSIQGKYGKASDDETIDKLQKQITGSKEKATGFYGDFIDNLTTGREIDDVMKYDSFDVLNSAMQRLELLNAAGIFNASPPPFGASKVRVHQIKSLSSEQQVLFVKLRLQSIFDRWKLAGATQSGTELRHVVFLDEAHKYFSKEPDDIINVIAKEARKFGIGLWCASQSPSAFPEDFLTNVGATVLLGIHSSFWDKTQRALRISEDGLKYIKMKEVIAIKLQKSGEADPAFRNVIVPNPNNPDGRVAAEFKG